MLKIPCAPHSSFSLTRNLGLGDLVFESHSRVHPLYGLEHVTIIICKAVGASHVTVTILPNNQTSVQKQSVFLRTITVIGVNTFI